MDNEETLGNAGRIEDKLGTVTNVSDMAFALAQRITELRQQAGAPALYANKSLMDAAQDDAYRASGGIGLPGDVRAHAQEFGYEAHAVNRIYLSGSQGNPKAPADISVLVTNLERDLDRKLLVDKGFNEVGIGVGGSCYGLFAVIYLGSRTAAPGPNP